MNTMTEIIAMIEIYNVIFSSSDQFVVRTSLSPQTAIHQNIAIVANAICIFYRLASIKVDDVPCCLEPV